MVGLELGRCDEPFNESTPVCGSRGLSEFAPPPDLYLPKEVCWAERRLTSAPSFQGHVPFTPAQKAGLRYEWKVKEMLGHRWGQKFFPGPWFVYRDSPTKAAKLCQPDGMLTLPQGVVLFEIKIRWCQEAWWKMRHLYCPVVEKALGVPVVGLCVVTRSFDPAVVVPEPKPRLYLSEFRDYRKSDVDLRHKVDVFIYKGNER